MRPTTVASAPWYGRGDHKHGVISILASMAAALRDARRLGLHWRRLWYQFTPFEAYYAVGRYQDVLDLTAATIEGAGGLEEAYYYQGLALAATGQKGPREAYEAAIAYNPNFTPARDALEALMNND